MEPLHTVDQIRRGEAPLLAAERHPDELMRAAAAEVAAAAAGMLDPVPGARVLLLVGSGGNGGDALYAGAALAAAGARVTAALLTEAPHSRAAAALAAAGGRLRPAGELTGADLRGVDLAVDGVVGIGGAGALRAPAARLVAGLAAAGAPVLAVDIPSGVAADTGVAAAGAGDLPGHVTAAATVTFGGLRRAHALAPACGRVILADIALAAAGDRPAMGLAESLAGVRAADAAAPAVLIEALADPVPLPDLEPGPEEDKYSGGVLGLLAGSEAYPGAGVLAARAAVAATPAMVRVVGPVRAEVIRDRPEVVGHPDLASCGRVRAWAVGPGRGTGAAAVAELAALIDRAEPVLADADAVSILAAEPGLRAAWRARADRGRIGVLTPHAGEFRRLAAALRAEGRGIPDPEEGRIAAAAALAAATGSTVLLKGWATVIAAPGGAVTVVRAGSSWAATPGSGDVLTGLAGAHLARTGDPGALPAAAVIHALAAKLAARTPAGEAPASAGGIAAALREATAAVAARGGGAVAQ